MEEENKIDTTAASGVEQAVENTTASETVKEPTCVSNSAECAEAKVPTQQQYRKNGRNHSGRSAAQIQAASAASCGEVEDLSNFKEKLSGSNTSGYGDNPAENQQGERTERRPFRERGERSERGEFRERGERGERGEFRERGERGEFRDRNDRGERRPRRPRFNEDKPADVTAEANAEAAPTEESDSTREGPAFETEKKFSPRAIEVELTDKRTISNEASAKDGVVSYDSADCKCPSISLWTRIKEAIASLFGKKSDKKFKGKYRGDRKNWKNNRGERKFHGDRKGGGNFHRGGGYNKGGNNNRRRFNDRRPNGGNHGGEGTAS